MKICITLFLLFLITACGPKPAEVTIPADADIKTSLLIKRFTGGRTIEVTFFYTLPVQSGSKNDGGIETVAVEDPRLNGLALTVATSESGLPYYTIADAPITAQNTISAFINGKPYEAKLVPQSTLDNKSVTAVMVPKE